MESLKPQRGSVLQKNVEKKPFSRKVDTMLRFVLRSLRTELAQFEKLPAYRIFSNRSLEQMVDQKPLTLSDLKEIAGMGDYRCNRYGGTILLWIHKTLRDYQKYRTSYAQAKASQSAQREVQALFESGYELPEIASVRQVQEGSVIRSMEYLQESGQLMLREWIEQQLSKEPLEEGATFFQEEPFSSLRSAYEALGLDYESLRLCRMYVSQVERWEFTLEQ